MKYLISLLLVLVIIPSVIAIPELPHQFYGTIGNDNGPITSGTLTAKLDNKEFSTQIESGNYGLNEPFLIHREDSTETNIEFYVDNNKVHDFTYESGAYTELNFNIPIFTTQNTDNSPSGSSSSGNSNYRNNNIQTDNQQDDTITTPVTPQEDTSSDNEQKEEEKSSFQSFFVGLKNIAGKTVATPFKTTESSVIVSLIIAYLAIFVFLYIFTGKNFILKPRKTIKRAKKKISLWWYWRSF